jgi:catechol 2,3-dioxygenase-like lactoylglutathione lyase family enzyme
VIGRLEKTVLDCPDPRALAAFYTQVLGMRCRRLPAERENGFRVFADPVGHPFCLVF